MEGMEDDEIAAAMGFSSFGGTKKRKYEHPTSTSPTAASSSGANTTRLGVRPKIEKSENEKAQESSAEDSLPAVNNTEAQTTNSKGKQPKKQQQPAASSLADFLNRGHTLPDKPPAPAVVSNTTSQAAQSESTFLDPQSTMAQDPGRSIAEDDARGDAAASSTMISFGGEPISRAELNALRQGVRNAKGDLAYFLPSFVEDPWEKIGGLAGRQ